MSANRKIILALSMLLLASLACDFPPSPSPTVDVVATSVSGTQTAAAVVPATDTPEPTPESPPFLQLAYVKDGDVWYWNEGGVNTPLTSLGDIISVYLSQDGQMAAFVRGTDDINQEIGAINTDGSNLRTLVSLADFSTMVSHPDAISAIPYRLGWRPGTHSLAFTTRLTFDGPGLILDNQIWAIDADSLALSTLMPAGQGGDFTYSPDGSKIALVTGTQISVVNADGSNRLDLLTFPGILTYSEYIYYPPVVWSPDGSFLRAAIPPHDPLVKPPELTTIWHLPADGSPPISLMTMVAEFFRGDKATLSPDTGKVAYMVTITQGAPPIVDLHISNADGTGDTIYDNGDRRFEAWSTDGEYFIFSEAGHNPRIGRIGSPPQNITGVTLMLNTIWVDETRFLYINRLSGSWELWLGELGASATIIGSSPERIGFGFTN